MASSSAALVLPVLQGQRLGGEPVVQLVAQVAVADIACIVALPFAIDPGRAGPAALGVLLILAAAGVAVGLADLLERSGVRRKVHRLSERRKLALELRTSLLVLFALAAVATWARVSVLLAGFLLGLGVAAVGEPRRLARQLFAVTDGFFSPVLFRRLGTSLDLRALGARPVLVLLGLALGLGAVLSHAGGPTRGAAAVPGHPGRGAARRPRRRGDVGSAAARPGAGGAGRAPARSAGHRGDDSRCRGWRAGRRYGTPTVPSPAPG